MVRENGIREPSMGVGACIHQKGSYDGLCGAGVMGIVGLYEKIVVQENDIHEHLAEIEICVGVRVIGIVGLREEIEVRENDIHEHLAEVDICVRQKETCDDWCDLE